MEKITSNMTEEQKQQFAADCMAVTMPNVMKTAFRGAFSKAKMVAPSETEMFKPLQGLSVDEIHAKAMEVRRNMDKVEANKEAKVESLKNDRNAIVQKAVQAMRKAAAENFGTVESQQAQITADESGIKDFGGEKWEVTGQYVGPDKKGQKFQALWTAKISLMFDNLQCESIKLGDRQDSK